MFGPSQWNAEDIDDYLVMQRDWGVDGGLRTASERQVAALRARAVDAVRAVYRHLGLGDFTDEWAAQAVDAAGSKDVPAAELMTPLVASRIIRETGLTMLDVVAALYETGFEVEADRVLSMLKARVAGDYLQTAAIFDESFRVLSLVTDPNDYAGPGSGYAPSRPGRRRSTRCARSARWTTCAGTRTGSPRLGSGVGAATGDRPARGRRRGVPAVGREVWQTLSGLAVVDVLGELLAGLEEEGCVGRVVRVNHTIDLGLIGLTAARLPARGSASGCRAREPRSSTAAT